jgi:hypothetical protein
MDHASVHIVMSPFAVRDGTQTSEWDYVALVCDDKVMVFRAENLTQHEQWVQAMRSRLLHPVASTRMTELYGINERLSMIRETREYLKGGT